MSDTEDMLLEIQKIISKYQAKVHAKSRKRGVAISKPKRLEAAKEKLHSLLLEVEYDFILHIVNFYLNTLSEQQLQFLIEKAEEMLEVDEVAKDTFPPSTLGEMEAERRTKK